MFPKWKYHPDGRSLKIADAETEIKLGKDWGDKPFPAGYQKPKAGECPSCANMRLQFERSYADLTEEHRKLQQKLAAHMAEHQKLMDRCQMLAAENELFKEQAAAAPTTEVTAPARSKRR